MYLASKTACHKPYRDPQLLLISTHWYKDLSINFIMGLLISINWKSKSYNSILMIINYLIKMVYYKPVNITIDVPRLAKVIINRVICHYNIFESIVIDQGLLFILKFRSLLYYFLRIKKKLSITFYSQINGQIETQNSIMKVYLRVFINWE